MLHITDEQDTIFKPMPTPFCKVLSSKIIQSKMVRRKKTQVSPKHNFKVCLCLYHVTVAHLFIYRCGVIYGPRMPTTTIPTKSQHAMLSPRTLRRHRYNVFIAYVDVYHLECIRIMCFVDAIVSVLQCPPSPS